MATTQHLLQLPAGFCQLETQVAGHIFEATNASSIGLLQNEETGCVLKPFGKPACGERELKFYEALNAASNNGQTLLAEATQFVPKFYEKVNLVVNGREHTFIKLEDLTHGMLMPCIMDIKIGKRTWDPLASSEKRDVEEKKYVQCKQTLGLCLPGFQAYVPAPSKPYQTILVRQSKDFGKSLTPLGFQDAMAHFLNVETKTLQSRSAASKILLQEVLRQLYSIRNWFKRQNIYNFYASSLLITYDYAHLQKTKIKLNGHHDHHDHFNNITTDAEKTASKDKDNDEGVKSAKDYTLFLADAFVPASHWIKVRMIDFAHVFPAENGQIDTNYLFGLENLISSVETLIFG